MYNADHLLVAPSHQVSSHVHLGPQKTFLSSADMVIPLLCGIFVHLFYITLLLPILILYYDDYNNVKQNLDIHFEIYLISTLLIHIFTLITNILSSVIAFRTKVLTTSKWLNILITIRLCLTFLEVFVIIYGLFVLYILDFETENEILYILITINLLSNLVLIFTTWCILFCCCKAPKLDSTDIVESRQSCNSFLNKYCSLCFYDQQSRFDEMGGLITILMRGNPYDHLELTPSDIVTGLHLLRMLQKHYGLFDEKLRVPFHENQQGENVERLKELRYYSLYANAAYGIGLYTLSEPCSICCAGPCSLPHDLDVDILQRSDEYCCNGIQIDNSNLKVFIQRTGISVSDLLLVAQIGDVNKVNFYVNIDRDKEALVISLRGTMSIKDSLTDIECNPMHFPEIDDACYVHGGIGKCAKYVFDIITSNDRILTFLTQNTTYDVVICGHSLGGGVCVILSLMFKYGVRNDINHLNLFINERRSFKAFAIAPPSVIERTFAFKINDAISEFLTCVVYGYDFIPRLTFNGIVFTRAAINRLLLECIQTPWWIYEKSLRVTHSTIVDALKHDSKYINQYVVISHNEEKEEKKEEDIMPGYDYFLKVVMNDVENMKKTAIQHNLSPPELWSTKLSQIGFILHIVKDDMNRLHNDEEDSVLMQPRVRKRDCIKNICNTIWQSIVCNVLKCRICLDEEDAKYYVYRADQKFCDSLLISPYLLADHMPQVYLNVLHNAFN